MSSCAIEVSKSNFRFLKKKHICRFYDIKIINKEGGGGTRTRSDSDSFQVPKKKTGKTFWNGLDGAKKTMWVGRLLFGPNAINNETNDADGSKFLENRSIVIADSPPFSWPTLDVASTSTERNYRSETVVVHRIVPCWQMKSIFFFKKRRGDPILFISILKIKIFLFLWKGETISGPWHIRQANDVDEWDLRAPLQFVLNFNSPFSCPASHFHNFFFIIHKKIVGPAFIFYPKPCISWIFFFERKWKKKTNSNSLCMAVGRWESAKGTHPHEVINQTWPMVGM